MTKIVEMFRSCQYATADDAKELGGMYSTIVHNDAMLEDVIEAITNACDMMDGGYSVMYRVRDEVSPEVVLFHKEFNSAFGYDVPLDDVAAIIRSNNAEAGYDYGTCVFDAWLLWSAAIKHSRGAVPTTGFVPLRRDIGNPTKNWFGFKDGEVLSLGAHPTIDDVDAKTDGQHCQWIWDEKDMRTLYESVGRMLNAV